MDLNESVAIVTGGARGIGRGIALSLAREGANIAIADLPDVRNAADETKGQIEELGRRALLIDVDVTDESQVQAMASTVLSELGSIDVLVNNAGVIKVAPVPMMDEATWDLIFDVNVKGTFLCAKAVAPHMIEKRRGRIINLASMAGKSGAGGVSAYCASKFAVIGFTQSLAHEMAPFDVTVNAICPGEVKTFMWDEVLSPTIAATRGGTPDEAFEGFIKDRVPLGRAQTAEDIGQCAVYLCRADNVTGEAINVTGGSEMH
ncbi:MAG TPA: SDR family NAD(P)-dependent oxidoreductase [Dehalococcoidia bacterium]|nr:SDR family NAD(P)-dependent oxidoreductase [Dehalococcoidia bacterium]